MPHIENKSYYIPTTGNEKLHLKRFYKDPDGIPVFMLHGSIENGRIFYSTSGKGLAPFLAGQGYDVFVADLRGRGKSKPKINKNSKHGLDDYLRYDLEAFLSKIIEIKGNVKQHWMAHSWGGVLLLSFLARNNNYLSKIGSMAFFGTKRRISVFTLKKLFMVNLIWDLFFNILIRIYGYLPAVKYKVGSDNETANSHAQTNKWVKDKKWLDWFDGFDYAAALHKISLPPTLYLTGINDDVLGNAIDVKILMQETGKQVNEFHLLSHANGNKQDYDHINILTHPDAIHDHFLIVKDWIAKRH